jgi:hypothetical protein
VRLEYERHSIFAACFGEWMKPDFAFRRGFGGPGHYVLVSRELWPIATAAQRRKVAVALYELREPLPRHTADVWHWDGKEFHETDLVFDARDEE